MLRMTIILMMLIPINLALAEDPDLRELIEVEITTIAGFTVVGMDYQGSNPEEIMTLWEEFTPRIQEIPGVEMDDNAYGVHLAFDEATEEFSYLACVESDMTGPLPEGMIELGIEGGKYAVFTFPFTLLDDIYAYAYWEWLPVSEYSHGYGYDFEYYPADFIPSDEGILMKLYMSVK